MFFPLPRMLRKFFRSFPLSCLLLIRNRVITFVLADVELCASHQLLVTNYQLLVTSHQLLVTSHQLPVTSHQLLVTGHQLLVTSHQLLVLVTSYQLLVASQQFLVTSYQNFQSIVTSLLVSSCQSLASRKLVTSQKSLVTSI